MLVGWLYYRGHLNRAKRILAEKENENLKLGQENLRKEKEKVELERDKKSSGNCQPQIRNSPVGKRA